MKKKILSAAAALAVIIIAICLARAAMFKSKQITVEPATVTGIDQHAIAENLSRAIQLKTISHQDAAKFDGPTFFAFHRLLERTFPRAHKTLAREIISKYSLLYTWKGQDRFARPILLLGHLDVVPSEYSQENSWTHDAFEGRIADGFIWGRGALDDKNALLGCLEAVEGLLKREPRQERDE